VHLEAFPESLPSEIDESLEWEMAAVRALVSLGRAAREEVKIRVRQPLGKLYAVVPGDVEIREEVMDLLREELNVKEVDFLASADGLISLNAKPNYKVLGPRFGKETEAAATAIRNLAEVDLEAYRSDGDVSIEVSGQTIALEPGDLEIHEVSKEGLVLRSENGFTAALDPALDDDLRAEGLARELVNRIQRLRKDSGLEITDRILLGVYGTERIQEAARSHQTFIRGETLAVEMEIDGDGGATRAYDSVQDVQIDELEVVIMLQRDAGADPQGSRAKTGVAD
jgi:isoleucyl-tRNA synthetase